MLIYSGPGEKPKSQIGDLHKCVSSVGLGMASAAGTLNPQLFQIMTVFGMISDNGGVWKYLQIIARVGLGTALLDYVPNVPNNCAQTQCTSNRTPYPPWGKQTKWGHEENSETKSSVFSTLMKVKHSSIFKRTTLLTSYQM